MPLLCQFPSQASTTVLSNPRPFANRNSNDGRVFHMKRIPVIQDIYVCHFTGPDSAQLIASEIPASLTPQPFLGGTPCAVRTLCEKSAVFHHR